MKNWITYNLADICKNIYSGGTPSTKHPEYWGGNLKWLSSGETSQKFIYDTQRKITEAGVNNSSTKLAHKNSVVIATAGQGYTRGQVSFLMTDTYMNQSVIACQPDERKVLPLYLYYNLDSRYAELRLLSDGTSTRGGLSGRILKKMEILLPSIEEQSKIVAMLYSLDKKVEINESINKNLEEQAWSVFSKYYDAAESQSKFTALIDVLGGGTPKTNTPDFWNGSIPFFTPKDVGMPYTFHTEKHLTKAGLEHCNSKLYPKNTTFVTARGTVGKISLAGIPMAMNQSCYALISKKINPILVYFYVHKAVNSLKHKASGAVFDAIVTRDFDTETLNVLDKNDSRTVLSVIEPIMGAIHTNSENNIYLSNLKNYLIPKLMSGDIDVSNIDL